MSYRVIAPLVLVRVPGLNGDYRVDYHYAGSLIPELTDEQSERFLNEGLVEELSTSEEPAPVADGRPRKTASQAEWASYAITQGADPDEAGSASRQELIELYGG